VRKDVVEYQLYGGIQYKCTLLSRGKYYTGRKQCRMDQQYTLGCCTSVQCCSSLPSLYPHPSTLPRPDAPLPSSVCLIPHPTSLPHPNPLLSSLGLRPNLFFSHSFICHTYFPCHASLLSSVILKPHPFLKTHVSLPHPQDFPA
jgi:hypothetical protein